jgi:hypothetical protein
MYLTRPALAAAFRFSLKKSLDIVKTTFSGLKLLVLLA